MKATFLLGSLHLLFATCSGAPAPSLEAEGQLKEAAKLLAEDDPDGALAITDKLRKAYPNWAAAFVLAGDGNLKLSKIERRGLNAQAVLAEIIAARVADEANRPTDHDARVVQVTPEGGEQLAEEQRDHLLQPPGRTEDAGLGEAALREVAFHRHDQPALERILEIGLDGRRSRRMPRLPAGAVPEAEHGAEHLAGRVLESLAAAIRAQPGDDAIGRAEIDADRRAHGRGGLGAAGRAACRRRAVNGLHGSLRHCTAGS